MRFCYACDKLVPKACFPTGPGKWRKCTANHDGDQTADSGTVKRIMPVTPERQAFISIRGRARKDMNMFGHGRLGLHIRDILAMLTPEQIENVGKYSLVPIVPSAPLSKTNAMIVTCAQRAQAFECWRASNRDDAAYKRGLERALNEIQ